jgi:DNA-binding IclR family transcriptional regulator
MNDPKSTMNERNMKDAKLRPNRRGSALPEEQSRKKSAAQEDSSEKSQVQVIARAASILRSLENQPAGLSLGQIALRVGLARSTVQRIVAALAFEKFLVAASPGARVTLGPELLRLGGTIRFDIVQLAHPLLARVSNDLRETVDLATFKGDRLTFVDQVIGAQRLRTVSAVGEQFPLYCTANGKAYLATLTDPEVEMLIGEDLPRRTTHTITDLGRLLTELAEVRRSGVAFAREEHSLGISAAGVAVADPFGNPVALTVPAPTHRFKRNEQTITNRLLTAKTELANMMAS